MGLFSRQQSTPVPPAVPRMEGLMLTPRSLTDAGEKGQRKRTELLENQIREISKTASKAYDRVDELEAKNRALEEQLRHQSAIVRRLNEELDEARAMDSTSQTSSTNVMSVRSGDTTTLTIPTPTNTCPDKVQLGRIAEQKQLAQIEELQRRNRELEVQSEKMLEEHRESINQLKASVLAMCNNRNFLDSEIPATPQMTEPYMGDLLTKDQGDTYVVSLQI